MPPFITKCHVSKARRIAQGISCGCDDVGVSSRLNRADRVRGADEIGCIARRREQRLAGLQTVRGEERKFLRVIAFANVRAVGNLDARLHRQRQIALGREIVGEFLGNPFPGFQQLRLIVRDRVEDLIDGERGHKVGAVRLHPARQTSGPLRNDPCSTESTPARTAFPIAIAGYRWAATFMPNEWAVSTAARISSSVMSC